MVNKLFTYPSDFEAKIGFDKIRQLLDVYCMSSVGRELVREITPQIDKEFIDESLNEQEELVKILSGSRASLPENGFYDMRKEISLLSAEGSWWEPENFIDLRSMLRTAMELMKILNHPESIYLKKYHANIIFPNKLLSQLEKIFNDKGDVSDNASPELNKLRRSIEQNRQQVRKSLDIIFRSAKQEGWVPEGSSIAIRDGRMVIPVTAEAKRRVKGFIHDESSTGQTVFIEPAAVLDGNNRQRELEYEERREVVRILKYISQEVYSENTAIGAITFFMGFIDFLRAKARLSDKLNAIKPQVQSVSCIKLFGARHPILLLTGHDVIPLDLEINSKQRLILISGPNAGGKSVALKTVALLQYMIQSGIFIPVGEGTEIGIFNNIFIDIGDEQSIENDLSTYSSHLKNMKAMLQGMDEKSLLLIDEFGSGTEPLFGGALAESMLEQFVTCGVRGVITTHYGNLKTFAEKNEGILNAAMLFDLEKLQPLYRLNIGKPGSSHALDIAYNTGLPNNIIERAKNLLGRETIDYDRTLSELQDQLKKVKDRQEYIDKKEAKLNDVIEGYQKLRETLESRQKQMLDRAKMDAEALILNANKEIERTIRHIKENKADKGETKKVRQHLESLRPKGDKSGLHKASLPKPAESLKTGDFVRLRDSNVTGQIIDVQGKKAEIMIGNLKTYLDMHKIEKITRNELKTNRSERRRSMDFTSKLASFSSTLDVRGKRAEETIAIVDKYIDDALLAGAGEVKILHGKGNGILKELIRNHLKSYKQVRHLADEHVERGGSGITVVQLDNE